MSIAVEQVLGVAGCESWYRFYSAVLETYETDTKTDTKDRSLMAANAELASSPVGAVGPFWCLFGVGFWRASGRLGSRRET